MSTNKSKQYLFDNPRNVKFVVRALVGLCIVLVGLDFIVHRHISHPVEEAFGFYAIYGFVGCVILVLIAKVMRKVLMRGEDYYDK